MDPLDEASKLLGVLLDVQNVCEKKRNNVEVMRELCLFIKNMKQAIEVLERRALDRFRARMDGTPRPSEDSSSIAGTYLTAQKNPISRALSGQLMAISEMAIARSALLCLASDELVEDLECAAEKLHQVLKVPRNSWNIDTLVERLRSVREIVVRSFQTKLHITNFDMTVDGDFGREEEKSSTWSRASNAVPRSVRQNFSTMTELEEDDILRQRYLSDELRRCLPRPGVDISSASQRWDPDFDSDVTSDSDSTSSPSEEISARGHSPPVRNTQARGIGNTETEAFFADVLANLEVMKAEVEAAAAQAESARRKNSEDEISEWFEDPITGEIMIDPIKCTDGRTYDRWTIIDNNLVKCPYDASMLDFHIAFDDIDVRARLFRAFPEKEQTYRARRQAHRQTALEHVRKGENRDALIKLNQVLQWNSHDEECKVARNQVQVQLEPTSVPPLPSISLVSPVASNHRSIRERMRGCSITGWLWRRRTPSSSSQNRARVA
ncbi:hypothetical protein R1sor_001709 [Riccia sorocarpa]|uniref:U-box domain-containing protein n=1 Tax=Riccia sorocarpa TaxID=122646 RepID=A0ABD3GWP4_9MARC